MQTNGIGQQYGFGLDFGQTQSSGKNATGTTADAAKSTTQARNQAARNARNAFGAGSVSGLSSAVAKVLKEMNLPEGERMTFAQVEKYRQKLESDFTAKVRKDLTDLKIDPKVEFRLVEGSDGGVSVISSHADKAKIEKYFKDNPSMVTQFQKIQTLTNLEQARKEQKVDPKALRTQLQMESMAMWFDQSGSVGSSMMDFNMQGASFMARLNKFI